jgi:hypothetical protein
MAACSLQFAVAIKRPQKNAHHHGLAFNILIYEAAFKMRYYPAFQKNRVASLLSFFSGK